MTAATTATIDGIPTTTLTPILKIFSDASAALNAKFGNITEDEAVAVDAADIAAVIDPVLAPYAAILPAAFPVANAIGNWIVSMFKPIVAAHPSIFAPDPSAPRFPGAPRAI